MAEKAKPTNNIKYTYIVYVSDRHISRLSEVVSSGLLAVKNTGYRNIALPPLRHQVMWKEIENSDNGSNREIAIGLNRYFMDHPDSKIESIKIIKDDGPTIYAGLILAIEKHKILKRC